MTTTDIATRVYNHAFKLDPIIRSLLDTDVYKLLMLQTIWKEFARVPVTFSLDVLADQPLAGGAPRGDHRRSGAL